MKKRGSSVRA